MAQFDYDIGILAEGLPGSRLQQVRPVRRKDPAHRKREVLGGDCLHFAAYRARR